MNTLREEGVTKVVGTYNGNAFGKESYFDLSAAPRGLVNDRVEEICIATHMLSLASNKKLGRVNESLRTT